MSRTPRCARTPRTPRRPDSHAPAPAPSPDDAPSRTPVSVPSARARVTGLLLVACALLAAAGCGKKTAPVEPRRIVCTTETTPFAIASRLDKTVVLQFHVTGTPQGAAASARANAADARVAFTAEFIDAEGAVHPGAALEERRADAGGMIQLPFDVGARPGIHRIRATLPDGPSTARAETVLLAGVVVEHDRQDGWAGHPLDEPLTVRFETAPGVYGTTGRVKAFLIEGPEGTRLPDPLVAVDPENNEVRLPVHLGSGQGPGAVALAFADSPLGPAAAEYSIRVRFFGLNWFILASSVAGGLALFIYGMKRMSDGLQFLAGEKMRQVLHWLTSNRFVAVGVGVFVTAAIQSSSACSVMVVGFVNAGLMTLQQAIGVLMGANIGTTITAQIIAFNLDDIALPAIALGVTVHALAKSSRVKNAALILLGFGMLFLGLTIMGDSLTQLKDSQWARGFFDALESGPGADGRLHLLPVLKGVAVGLIVTVIVQSSSVTTGLLIMLAAANLIDAYTAYAVLLGENIGTTITAILASLGASRAARRAALFHVLFNTFGVIGMIALHFVPWPGTGRPVFMELVAATVDGNPFAETPENLPRYLANAHTLFNLVTASVFLFLVGPMARLCTALIPETEEERKAKRKRLEPHFLQTPAIALQQAWGQLGHSLEDAHEAIRDAHRALGDPSDPDWEALAESVKEHERDTDDFQAEMTEFLGQLSLARLNERQAESIPHLLHGVNDIERIGDYGRHLIKLAKRMRKRDLPLSPSARSELMLLVSGLEEQFQWTAEAVRLRYDEQPPAVRLAAMRKASAQGSAAARHVQKLATEARKGHERRYETGDCDLRSGAIFLDIVTSLLRVGGHLKNVLEAAARDEPVS